MIIIISICLFIHLRKVIVFTRKDTQSVPGYIYILTYLPTGLVSGYNLYTIFIPWFATKCRGVQYYIAYYARDNEQWFLSFCIDAGDYHSGRVIWPRANQTRWDIKQPTPLYTVFHVPRKIININNLLSSCPRRMSRACIL